MDETRELLRLTKEGDEDAREKIVVNNMGLIWSVVKRFTNRGYDPEDLFQIGSIGLLKAVDKFDLSYDVKFSTYAVPMITGEIKRFLRDVQKIVELEKGIKELIDFDDNKLFPYISQLLTSLKAAVNPSPMTFL